MGNIARNAPNFSGETFINRIMRQETKEQTMKLIPKKTSHKLILAAVVGLALGWYFKPQIDMVLAQLPFGAPAAPVATAAFYAPFN